MLKKHMAACLVVTAFAAAPAFAQTSSSTAPTDRPAATGSGSTSTGSPAVQPGMSGSSSSMNQPSATMSQSGAMQGQFMTKMDADQMMASDLIGTRVISANNESIGDINDVILDRDGRVMAAVVGVGGFLGIGEKDVAVPFSALEFLTDQQVQAMNNGNKGNVATTGSTATGSSTAGSSMTGSTATTNTMSSDDDRNEPERVMLRMTKAELQAAPAFDEDGDDNNRSTTGTTGVTSPAPAGTTTAPKK